MNQDLVVLVDGSSYLYRAFHALPALTNSNGLPTGAIYGVINMLKRLLKDYDPKYVAVIFDAKGKTFRDDLYKDYKANRPPMPSDLSQQIEPLHDIIRAMHIPLLVIDGVEADDVIGTLAQEAERSGLNTLISTGDKDMAQLVNEKITLIDTMKNKLSDRDGVIEKFGVPPELIIDYLALIGDASDNVPGVPKVGPKTAVKWLDEYGSLDNVMKNAENIKGKVGENLVNSLNHLPLSKELVTIKCDVLLACKVNDLLASKPDEDKLIDLYRRFEFKTWLSAALEKNQPDVKIEKKYEAITNEKQLDAWLERIKNADLFAFDTETNDLNYMNAEVVGLSFAVEPHHAAYVPVAHANVVEQLDRDIVFKKIKPILEDPSIKKVGHNLKYDKEVLLNHGIELKGIAFDTMLESYVADSTATRHDLDTLALKYLGHKNIKFEDVAGKGVKQITFDQVALDQAVPYAAEDADITLQLHLNLWPRIKDDEKLKYIFDSVEMPLINVLTTMERTGFLIDSSMLKKQSVYLEKQIGSLQVKMYELAGNEFNANSPKQLQAILYEQLGIPVIKKTPKGQPSTAEPVLRELADEHELPELILSYRSLSKLKSTYTDKLPEQVNSKTGRIHTSFHQAVAGTGRLSSSNPNLQNIPIRTEEGRKIREAFIAQEGYELVAADYSQIELRIMAHLSQDKGLIDAFAHNQDVHKATAAQVFSVALNEVTKDQRRKAKAINFGLIYGMSAFGLAKQLGVERTSAQAYIDSYFDQYPGVYNYMEKTREKAHEIGFVETLFGRRLFLPDINSKNIQRQKAMERAAINAPMQGTAADIIKQAMIKVYRWLEHSDIDARMLLQVHDELVFEVASADVDEAKQEIDALMSSATILDVPLIVDVGVGKNWNDAH